MIVSIANTNACNIPSKRVKKKIKRRLSPEARNIVSKSKDPRITLNHMLVMIDPPKMLPKRRNDIEITDDSLLIILRGIMIKKGLKKLPIYVRIPWCCIIVA